MGRLLLVLALAAMQVSASGAENAVAFSDDFSDGTVWPVRRNVTPNDLVLTFGASFGEKGPCLVVHGTETNRRDTAWIVRTAPRRLPPGNVSWRLAFEAAADMEVAAGGMEGEAWYTGVAWQDADGKTIRFDQIPFIIGDGGGFQRILQGGDIPSAASQFCVQIGFDRPNVYAGHRIAFRNVKLAVSPEVVASPPTRPRPDSLPPVVRILNHSPLPNPAENVEISVSDASGVDEKSVAVSIDGRDVTRTCVRKDCRFICKPPSDTWATGIHTVKVVVADCRGHRIAATRHFGVGEPPHSPDAKLRGDGTTLVDGKPFFPIGLYSVQKVDFNSNSFDVAFAQLRQAGMNFAQSYGRPAEDFLDAADRYGCKVLVRPWPNDGQFLSRRRHHPAVLAWYLADDTNRHFTPEQLASDDSFFRALDDHHLTAQADEVGSFVPVSNYTDYVPHTDVFLPEIYPMRKDRPDDSVETCVPEVVFDMKRARADAQTESPDRPRAIWAILPHFFEEKSAWNRYPTQRELRAMTFAAICNGANGILYYTYKLGSGAAKPDRGGAVSTPETWAALTNVTAELGTIYDVLCAAESEKASVEILSGPRQDIFGNGPISSVVKRWRGEEWIIAVNSTLKPVTARLTTSCGAFTESFAGQDVKIVRHALEGEPIACEAGFVPLFNGKDLTGWEGATDTYRLTEKGLLTCVQAGGPGRGGIRNLWTERDYSDFVIRFEVKLPKNANNGLGIRTKPNGWCSREGMEIQLLDDWGDAYNGKNRLDDVHYTGAVYGVVPPKRKPDGTTYLKPAGEWNSVEVTAIGTKIKVVLNGETIVDTDVAAFSTDGTVPPDGIRRPGLHNRSGRIHWCGHGENMYWRNVRIKEL